MSNDDLIATLDALPPEKHRGAYGLFTALQQAYEYWNKKQKAGQR